MREINKSDRLYFLWILLNQTNNIIFRLRRRELARYRIIIAENAILVSVHFLGDNATPAAISRRVFQEPQTVSVRINRFKADGVLMKERDPHFKNRVIIRLTDKGEKLLEKALRRKSLLPIISALTTGEQKQLWSILIKLRSKAITLEPSLKGKASLPVEQEIF